MTQPSVRARALERAHVADREIDDVQIVADAGAVGVG